MLSFIIKSARFFFLFLSFSSFASTIIENKGQIVQLNSNSEKILFYTSFEGGTAYFLKDRIAFVLTAKSDKTEFNNVFTGNKINTYRYDLKINSISKIQLKTGAVLSEKINFYTNGKRFCVNQYNKIIYKNIAEGTSIVFYNHPDKGLKYDIVFEHPDTKEVNFSFELIGAKAEKEIDKITKKETIVIKTPLGNVTERFPFIYADVKKNKKINRIEKSYTLSIENNTIFYSTSVPENCQSIVIDPWTSFAGGNDADECFGADGDKDGNVYISGHTLSVDFPSSPGAFQTGLNANYDAYLFKFDSTGQRLWATYYGGSQNDFGYRIKVSPSGKPTLSGYTYSSDLFVSTSGVFSSAFSGLIDAFITQFDANGNFLWGTFMGGTGGDFAISMDMDKLGFIALAGFTSSNDFPLSVGAWQSTFGGALDCFLAKFDSTGNRVWSTYMGGMNSEDAHAIKYDSFGNVIIAGDTYSTDFPVSASAYQNLLMGGGDAFVAKFNSAGNNVWATYLGGTGNEDIEGLASDISNNIYFTGYSASTDFPVTTGAFQSTMNGVRDASVGSFSPTGNLRWLTYVGGTAWDFGRGIIVNTNNKITVCGETNSTDYPIIGNIYDTLNNGISDIIYLTFDTAGTVELSNLKGGSNADYPNDICEVMQEKIVISGSTYSGDFPVTAGVFQTIKNADVDAFVWQIDSTSIITSSPFKPTNSFAYLYPNPTNEQTIITGIDAGDYDLLIYNKLGKIIGNKKINTQGEIHLNELKNLNSGVYSIYLFSKEKQYLFKVVKL